MSSKGENTYREIVGQPEAWAEALEVGRSAVAPLQALWRQAEARELLFTGCGSTHYLSLAAAALAREQGLAAKALPASEIWLFPSLAGPDLSHTLLVAVSRSGETTETVHAIEAFRRAGGKAAVTLGCYPESTIAQACDLTLAVPKGQEVSIAQTRSFAGMLVLARLLVAALAEDGRIAPAIASLPDLGRRIIDTYGELAAGLGGDKGLSRFFFLGNGPRYGLACEGMLKMKEMSLSYSEAYHPLEFRHGPKSVVTDDSLVIGLLSDTARGPEAAVLADMKGLGARTLALAEEGEAALADDVLRFASGLAEADRLVLYLPALQLLAYHRAIANGQDPDNPHNLTAVVTL